MRGWRDYGLKSSIIVKNYETNLHDDEKQKERKSEGRKVPWKSHIVCLWRESVSEARMDVFQTMV